MGNFKTFFIEAAGRFKMPGMGTTTSSNISRSIAKGTALSDEEAERRARLIDQFKVKRAKDYPGKFNFVLTDTFKQLLDSTWSLLKVEPVSFIVYGDPGVGKSDIIRNGAKSLTVKENKYFPSTDPDGNPVERKFVEWDSLQPQEKDVVMDHPERYYALLDIRAAFFTTASLEGLPVTVQRNLDNDLEDYNSKRFFDVIPQRFIAYITNPKAAGVLFLDEFNQSSTEVKNIFLKIILDRKFQDLPISPRILILAASNIGAAFRGQDMNPALSSRFMGAVLVPDPEAWYKYAEQQGIDDWIIDFVKQDPDQNFYRFPADKNVQFPSPRSISRFSKGFKELLKEYDEIKATGDEQQEREFDLMGQIKTLAAGLIDSQWADEFIDHLKKSHEFDIAGLAADEEKFKSMGMTEQKRLSQVLIRNILAEIDDAVIPNLHVPLELEDGSSVNIPGYDDKKLKANLANSVSILKRLSDEDFIMVLKGVKKQYYPYGFLLFQELKGDKNTNDRIDRIFATIPTKI